MQQNKQQKPPEGTLVLLLVMLNAFVFESGLGANERWYLPLFVTLPLLIVSIGYWRRAS